MRAVTYRVFEFAARLFGKLSRICSRVAQKLQASDAQRRGVVSSTSYDMVAAPDEPYYGEQYWQAMRPHLASVPKKALVLDLGCSQGRFTTSLAAQFPQGRVVACDLSNEAIQQARAYAEGGVARNVDFRTQSISDCIDEFDDESVDVVVMTEVTIFYPEWVAEVPRIVRRLKEGGLFLVSFRSQYFNAMCIARGRLWNSVETVLNERQGAIFASPIVFTWQTSAEIRDTLVEQHGLDLLAMRGIGVCSGIPGDPHDHICRPSQLSRAEKEQLMKLEAGLCDSVPDGGRYILAVARKPSRESV